MADATTPNLGLTLPTVGADSDDWGAILNADLGQIDALFANTGTTALGTAALGDEKALLPTGTPLMWLSTVAPAGFILATGQTVLRADYPALWTFAQATIAAGENVFGAGDGSTNFVLPDLRDRFMVGAGNAYAVGAKGGSTSQTPTVTIAGHSITPAELPNYNLTVNQTPHGHQNGGATIADIDTGGNSMVNTVAHGLGGRNFTTGNIDGVFDFVSTSNANIGVNSGGGNAAHGHAGSTASAIDVRPPYFGMNFIIKT